MKDERKNKIRPVRISNGREASGDVYRDRIWPEHPRYWGYEVDEDGNAVVKK